MTTSPSSPSSRKLRRLSSEDPLPVNREQHWTNEQYVDDVSLEFLYSPHTLTALGVVLVVVMTTAVMWDSEAHSMLENSKLAAALGVFLFLVLSMLVFPSGPFIRPHPLVWRVAFGVSVLYELFLLVLAFQKRDDARKFLTFFHSDLNRPLVERSYAADCSVTWETISSGVFDRYFLAHFVGWTLKSLMIRDFVICWIVSIQWEIIELAFTHMLPNFAECWWDSWVMDVMIANAFGIFVGHALCRYLEVKQYRWSRIQSFPTAWGKVKRVALQFTPERWTVVRWEKMKSVRRFGAIHILIVCMHIQELNSFFLKHILWIPPENPLNPIRLAIWSFTGVPILRQIYVYCCDPKCKRLGSQAWVGVVMLVTELVIISKFSHGLFTKPMPPNIAKLVWIFVSIYCIGALFFLLRIKSQNSKKQSSSDKKNE